MRVSAPQSQSQAHQKQHDSSCCLAPSIVASQSLTRQFVQPHSWCPARRLQPSLLCSAQPCWGLHSLRAPCHFNQLGAGLLLSMLAYAMQNCRFGVQMKSASKECQVEGEVEERASSLPTQKARQELSCSNCDVQRKAPNLQHDMRYHWIHFCHWCVAFGAVPA